MAAGFEQTNAAHPHSADDEFAVQQIESRPSSSAASCRTSSSTRLTALSERLTAFQESRKNRSPSKPRSAKARTAGSETISPEDSGVTKIAATRPCHAGVGDLKPRHNSGSISSGIALISCAIGPPQNDTGH